MSGLPSLTLLSDEQKFNGNNLLQWKTNITRLLSSKGLLEYIDGKIAKPSPPIPTDSSNTKETPTVAVSIAATPVYSSIPTLMNGSSEISLLKDTLPSTVLMS